MLRSLIPRAFRHSSDTPKVSNATTSEPIPKAVGGSLLRLSYAPIDSTFLSYFAGNSQKLLYIRYHGENGGYFTIYQVEGKVVYYTLSMQEVLDFFTRHFMRGTRVKIVGFNNDEETLCTFMMRAHKTTNMCWAATIAMSLYTKVHPFYYDLYNPALAKEPIQNFNFGDVVMSAHYYMPFERVYVSASQETAPFFYVVLEHRHEDQVTNVMSIKIAGVQHVNEFIRYFVPRSTPCVTLHVPSDVHKPFTRFLSSESYTFHFE